MITNAKSNEIHVYTVFDSPLSPCNTWHGDPQLKAHVIGVLDRMEWTGDTDEIAARFLPTLMRELGSEGASDTQICQFLGFPLWWPQAFTALAMDVYAANANEAWQRIRSLLTEIPVGVDLGPMFATFGALRTREEFIPAIKDLEHHDRRLEGISGKLEQVVGALTGEMSAEEAFEVIRKIKIAGVTTRAKVWVAGHALSQTFVRKASNEIEYAAGESTSYAITLRMESYGDYNGKAFTDAVDREVERQIYCYRALEAGETPIDIINSREKGTRITLP